ncbi:unnamed protein product, partial [marine sediment metagenome]
NKQEAEKKVRAIFKKNLKPPPNGYTMLELIQLMEEVELFSVDAKLEAARVVNKMIADDNKRLEKELEQLKKEKGG